MLRVWLPTACEPAPSDPVSQDQAVIETAMVPALPVFDLAVLLNQLGQDEALARMLVQSALQDLPAYWQQLESAIEQSAWAQAQRSSHTLKGLCAQMGGLRAAETFKDVNLRLKQGLSVQQAEAVVLSKEYKDLAAALQQWLVSSSS